MHKSLDKEVVFLESPTKKRYNYGKFPCFGVYYKPSGLEPETAFLSVHYGGE